MTCDNCTFAEWKRTKTGRLHPDKSGRCKWMAERGLDLRLPVAFYWLGYDGGRHPLPTGGRIERGKRHKAPCIFKNGEPQ